MKYLSTRGHADRKQFCDILLEGLAPDGGLYLPERYPHKKIVPAAAGRPASGSSNRPKTPVLSSSGRCRFHAVSRASDPSRVHPKEPGMPKPVPSTPLPGALSRHPHLAVAVLATAVTILPFTAAHAGTGGTEQRPR